MAIAFLALFTAPIFTGLYLDQSESTYVRFWSSFFILILINSVNYLLYFFCPFHVLYATGEDGETA